MKDFFRYTGTGKAIIGCGLGFFIVSSIVGFLWFIAPYHPDIPELSEEIDYIAPFVIQVGAFVAVLLVIVQFILEYFDLE